MPNSRIPRLFASGNSRSQYFPCLYTTFTNETNEPIKVGVLSKKIFKMAFYEDQNYFGIQRLYTHHTFATVLSDSHFDV